MFDVEAGSWSHGPVGTTPTPLYGHCSARGQEKIFIIGGLNSNTNYLSSTFTFSPSTMQWEVEGDLQQARVHHACAGLGGGVVVAGGRISGEYLDSVEWWDPTDRRWSMLGRLVVAREYHSLSVMITTLLYLTLTTS